MMERQIKTTADGSFTLFVPALNEHYHSFHGALQEAKHIFIKHGLAELADLPRPVSVLEMGLGTGLNALLTAEWALQNKQTVFYTAVEKYPLQWQEAQALQYDGLFQETSMQHVFQQIHTAMPGHPMNIHPYFQLTVHHQDMRMMRLPGGYDTVFFDAFAPEKQPDLWDLSIFLPIYNSLLKGGHLVTYCAKGSVKRTLKAAGFKVEALPGPPGKREMTKAYKV